MTSSIGRASTDNAVGVGLIYGKSNFRSMSLCSLLINLINLITSWSKLIVLNILVFT